MAYRKRPTSISGMSYRLLRAVRDNNGATTREVADMLGDGDSAAWRIKVSSHLSLLKQAQSVSARLWEGAQKLRWFITPTGLAQIDRFEELLLTSIEVYAQAEALNSRPNGTISTRWRGPRLPWELRKGYLPETILDFSDLPLSG